MKRLNIMFLMLIFLLSILMLQGCKASPPLSFSSVLEINTDESGTRTIQLSANRSTLNTLFKNGNFSFQSFIAANCPKQFDWSYIETSSSYEFSFVLSFNSLNEYQQKMAAITGSSGCVAISRPETGISTGFTLSESVDVLSLFSWFTSSLTERTGKTMADLEEYIVQASNDFIYSGRSYPQEESTLHCYIENLMDAEFIDILTTLTPDGSCSRTLYIRFPDAILDNSDNVKKYLTTLLPKQVKESWIQETTWCLTFSSDTVSGLGQIMNSIFQTTTPQCLEESVKNEHPLSIVHAYTEPVDFSFFVPEAGETKLRYYINYDPDVSVTADGIGSNSAINQAPVYDGYKCIYNKKTSKQNDFSFRLLYQYQPARINSLLRVNSIQDISRTISFSLGNVPELHQKLISSKLSEAADGYGLVKADDDDDNFTVYFLQDGTPSKLAAGFEAVFGTKEELSYTSKPLQLFCHTQDFSFSDSIDFSSFLISEGATQISCIAEFARDPDAECTVETGDYRIDISRELHCSNPAYIWSLLTLLFSISAVLYVIYLKTS